MTSAGFPPLSEASLNLSRVQSCKQHTTHNTRSHPSRDL